ncbi:TPA: hypothetical protein N0F65_005021 [Lagenidium giganteum]|uniref:Myb-like domain-containing protein n=1 Tax=Lagenidium giganteum TaxID=4803 RepID=A0AAV2ZCJ4_9STRA|nr:TPA: hypothetical protein N0F65_005021 [Lagenidium giganteum]
MHKWLFHLRDWFPTGRIQVYDGSESHRKRLQREWKKRKLAVGDDEDDEDARELLCCVCPVRRFVEDQEAFVAFSEWHFLVVEGEHDSRFDAPDTIKALRRVRQRKTRLLCHSQPPESWNSSILRSHWASFLIDGLYDSSEDWSVDTWSKHVVLDKSSASSLLRASGKTSKSSSSSSFWRSQQDHMNGLLVALACLSLRRVRREVESELGKVEEQSLSCTLSPSQAVQYRNALSGFAASLSEREDRMEMWLLLFLRLRSICNAVDLVNDMDKLGLADIAMIESCSGKLSCLHGLLQRVVSKEEKRVVIYCQHEALFPVLEMLLNLLELSYVRVTGSNTMQRRALQHFAMRPAVQVALVPTRLSCLSGHRSMPVYGADVMIVVDSDWNAICDAKLRASWAKVAVAREIHVYRVHCEATIESALLRVGSCLSEKVFSEMTPAELLSVPSDGSVMSVVSLEKPSWWTANGGNGHFVASCLQVEEKEAYCSTEIDSPLTVLNAEVDAEEHLLLANTDELTPVEWYAVNFVHSTTDKKRHEAENATPGEESTLDLSDMLVGGEQSFDGAAVAESRKTWQEADTSKLFYTCETRRKRGRSVDQTNDGYLHQLLEQLRESGLEVSYESVKPPLPPVSFEYVGSDPGAPSAHQAIFHLSYRYPAPAAPPPPPKTKADAASAQADQIKPRRPAAASASATNSTGVKRKLEQTTGSTKPPKETKEQRVDMEGIPLPDMAEFEDDDFWGDTNLDALDSASWDDASVLSGILGPSLDPTTAAASATTNAASSGSGTQKPPSKKSKSSASVGTTAGKPRKGSVSDGSRDGWSANDDQILKKLFEMYGSNWSLISQVFNSTSAVSRFMCKKRSPRQCYDRYGKIISGSLTSSSSTLSAGGLNSKDGKGSTSATTNKGTKSTTAKTWTPELVTARIGLPQEELLLVFPAQNSLPGLPPPSILNTPTLVELFMKQKKPLQAPSDNADDLKSIQGSFDAIIQCMKRKTAPPPIPIPIVSTEAAPPATVASPAATKATSSTQPALPPPTTPAAAVPAPHKSHIDMVSLLPSQALSPDEVIKRSKEAAAAAVHAAAAVASVGRDVSPLSSTGDVMLGTAFGASIATSRKAPPPMSLGGSQPTPTSTLASAPLSARAGSALTAAPGAPPVVPAGAWGDAPMMQHGISQAPSGLAKGMPPAVGGVGTSASMDASISGAPMQPVGAVGGVSMAGRSPMPVTTSTLLHVLDRMPEIKNKIQAILNRNDCSEAQKVAMIARLLSNTNAINTTAAAAAAAGVNLGAQQGITSTPTPMPVAIPGVSAPSSAPATVATSAAPSTMDAAIAPTGTFPASTHQVQAPPQPNQVHAKPQPVQPRESNGIGDMHAASSNDS